MRFVLPSLLSALVCSVFGCNSLRAPSPYQANYPPANQATAAAQQPSAPGPVAVNPADYSQFFPTSPQTLQPPPPAPAGPGALIDPAAATAPTASGPVLNSPGGTNPAWGGTGFRDTRWPF